MNPVTDVTIETMRVATFKRCNGNNVARSIVHAFGLRKVTLPYGSWWR